MHAVACKVIREGRAGLTVIHALFTVSHAHTTVQRYLQSVRRLCSCRILIVNVLPRTFAVYCILSKALHCHVIRHSLFVLPDAICSGLNWQFACSQACQPRTSTDTLCVCMQFVMLADFLYMLVNAIFVMTGNVSYDHRLVSLLNSTSTPSTHAIPPGKVMCASCMSN